MGRTPPGPPGLLVVNLLIPPILNSPPRLLTPTVAVLLSDRLSTEHLLLLVVIRGRGSGGTGRPYGLVVFEPRSRGTFRSRDGARCRVRFRGRPYGLGLDRGGVGRPYGLGVVRGVDVVGRPYGLFTGLVGGGIGRPYGLVDVAGVVELVVGVFMPEEADVVDRLVRLVRAPVAVLRVRVIGVVGAVYGLMLLSTLGMVIRPPRRLLGVRVDVGLGPSGVKLLIDGLFVDVDGLFTVLDDVVGPVYGLLLLKLGPPEAFFGAMLEVWRSLLVLLVPFLVVGPRVPGLSLERTFRLVFRSEVVRFVPVTVTRRPIPVNRLGSRCPMDLICLLPVVMVVGVTIVLVLNLRCMVLTIMTVVPPLSPLIVSVNVRRSSGPLKATDR